MGDTGFDLPVQKKVSKELEKEKCHSIHFLGDIIYPNGLETSRDPQFKKKFYDYYYHLTQKDEGPTLYLIMGNHDHKGSIYAWKEIAKKHDKIFFPHPYYLLKMNGVCLVHFDSDYYKLFLKFPLSFTQTDWIQRTNKELDSCEKKIALSHHPFDNSGGHHGPSKGWLRSFLRQNVIGKYDYLLSGHEHTLLDEGKKEGTHMLLSGAGGNPYKGKEAGFLVMTWNQKTKELSYSFRKFLPE